tara:strand:- start:1896 stop:2603 length:708 start_codon:yes stop_codon:yes gene_type:complete
MIKENKNIKRVLVVDDEPDIRELVQHHLEIEGFEVLSAPDGEKGLFLIQNELPDLIILDLMLPGIDGLEVCRKLNNIESTSDIPIIMLTAKGEEIDIIKGLAYGADDYVTKPFSPRVLMARAKAILRRQVINEIDVDEIIQIEELYIHPGKREVKVGSVYIELTFSEFEIIHFLARRPGWVFTRNQIINQVHGDDYPVTDRSVDFQIVGIRQKLGEMGKLIKTVRGVGYRFDSNN